MMQTLCCAAHCSPARPCASQEKGFEDIATARSDPDLAQLREDERFEGLLARLAPAATGSGPFGWLAYQLNFKNSAIAKCAPPSFQAPTFPA